MLPPALEGFFPANARTGTENLCVIPVVGRDILVARGSSDLVIDREQADVMKFFCEQRLVVGQWNGVDCEVWDLSPESRSMEGFSVIPAATSSFHWRAALSRCLNGKRITVSVAAVVARPRAPQMIMRCAA